MKRVFVTTILLAAFAVMLGTGAQAQNLPPTVSEPGTEKLAQTGFKFLSVSVDPRAAAMGGAITAQDRLSSVAMFHNPAGMARMGPSYHLSAGKLQWIADIDYNTASLAFSPAGGRFGVFGASVVAVNYGEVFGTIRANNEQGYMDYDDIGISNPSPTALAVGLGYARALTDRFSVGGHVKYAQQDLGSAVLNASDGGGFDTSNDQKSTVAFDFGVLYDTGFRSLTFAMSARNFSRELTYVEENFELPLTFNIGVAMNLVDLTSMNPDVHSFLLAVDAERPRDFAEQVRVGGEYTFMNTLALRAGYVYPTDEQGVNLGVGLHPTFNGIEFGFDYAYTTFSTFDNVHRLALQFGF